VNILQQSVEFLKESKSELGKVVFPSRQEVIGATLVVIFSVVVVSALLGLMDTGLSMLMAYIFK